MQCQRIAMQWLIGLTAVLLAATAAHPQDNTGPNTTARPRAAYVAMSRHAVHPSHAARGPNPE